MVAVVVPDDEDLTAVAAEPVNEGKPCTIVVPRIILGRAARGSVSLRKFVCGEGRISIDEPCKANGTRTTRRQSRAGSQLSLPSLPAVVPTRPMERPCRARELLPCSITLTAPNRERDTGLNAKLRRDRPDLHARVLDGELTAHAAPGQAPPSWR
jgi:hypothetical protein